MDTKTAHKTSNNCLSNGDPVTPGIQRKSLAWYFIPNRKLGSVGWALVLGSCSWAPDQRSEDETNASSGIT